MAQYKTAIFVGRDHPDTGLSEYKLLAQRFNLKLDIYTQTYNAAALFPRYQLAFVSRYLTILEALAAGVPVIAQYNNEIKYDYLSMTPFIKFIKIFKNYDDPNLNLHFNNQLIQSGRVWAKTQTWTKLAKIYEALWSR